MYNLTPRPIQEHLTRWRHFAGGDAIDNLLWRLADGDGFLGESGQSSLAGAANAWDKSTLLACQSVFPAAAYEERNSAKPPRNL